MEQDPSPSFKTKESKAQEHTSRSIYFMGGLAVQCSCGGSTRDKTSSKLDKEEGTRKVIQWSECSSCGRVLINSTYIINEEKADDDE